MIIMLPLFTSGTRQRSNKLLHKLGRVMTEFEDFTTSVVRKTLLLTFKSGLPRIAILQEEVGNLEKENC